MIMTLVRVCARMRVCVCGCVRTSVCVLFCTAPGGVSLHLDQPCQCMLYHLIDSAHLVCARQWPSPSLRQSLIGWAVIKSIWHGHLFFLMYSQPNYGPGTGLQWRQFELSVIKHPKQKANYTHLPHFLLIGLTRRFGRAVTSRLVRGDITIVPSGGESKTCMEALIYPIKWAPQNRVAPDKLGGL